MQPLVLAVVAMLAVAAAPCQGETADEVSWEQKIVEVQPDTDAGTVDGTSWEQKIVGFQPGFPFEPNTHRHESCLHQSPSFHPCVDFPAGRPAAENLESVCRAGGVDLRQGVQVPSSGYGWVRRRADALRKLERRLRACCARRAERRLRCAVTAWERSLDSFCEQESMVKDRQHHCCVGRGLDSEQRRSCFAGEAPNPDYSFPHVADEGPTAGHRLGLPWAPGGARAVHRSRGMRAGRSHRPRHGDAAPRHAPGLQ